MKHQKIPGKVIYIAFSHSLPSKAVGYSMLEMKCKAGTYYIKSIKFIRQLCQYIYLIKTQCHQQYYDSHWNTYISHYWYMPLKKYAYHIAHVHPTIFIK